MLFCCAPGEPDAGDLLDLSIALISGYAASMARRPLRAAFEAWVHWSALQSQRRCSQPNIVVLARLNLTHGAVLCVLQGVESCCLQHLCATQRGPAALTVPARPCVCGPCGRMRAMRMVDLSLN